MKPDFVPRIWWPKSNKEIEDRAEECRKSDLDLAYQACLDELYRRKNPNEVKHWQS